MFECLCCCIRLGPALVLSLMKVPDDRTLCVFSLSLQKRLVCLQKTSAPALTDPKRAHAADDDPDDLFAGLWLYYQSLIMTQSQSLDVKISLQSSNEPFTYSESGASWLASFLNALFLLAHSLRPQACHTILTVQMFVVSGEI